MRALSVEELGFVSGGGTPLAQQAEQAAHDRNMAAAAEALGDSGLTPQQQQFALQVMSTLLTMIGATVALATKNNAVRVAGAALAVVGVSLSLAADVVVLTFAPTPAY